MKDFFLSYNKADLSWAEWVAWTLEEAGYTTVIQSWDFRPGENFVLKMQSATIECNQTIAVLSPDYLASLFTQSEWSAAFAPDPLSQKRKLLPVRVELCEPPGLLQTIIYCDLVGLDKTAAREVLLKAVRNDRTKPVNPPDFPGSDEIDYPGESSPIRLKNVPAAIDAARELLDLLDTTYATFQAQCRVRNKVVDIISERLAIINWYQYEDFFSRYYSEMNEQERQLHKTIRAYTENVLSEYNIRTLDIIKKNPELAEHIPSLPALKRHLIIWLSKYQGVFLSSPSMCLVYVGVEEKVPFPSDIERELRDYVNKYEVKI